MITLASALWRQMQELAPEMRKLKEKYKDDPRAFQSELMALYRKHGVNPFGSCWLLLLQMPIFMGLYYALQESIHFRLAGFLWMDNLAAPADWELPVAGRCEVGGEAPVPPFFARSDDGVAADWWLRAEPAPVGPLPEPQVLRGVARIARLWELTGRFDPMVVADLLGD